MNNGQGMYPGNSVDSLLNPLSSINTIYCNSLNASYVELPLLNFSSDISELSNNNQSIALFPNPVGNTLKVTLLEKMSDNNTLYLFNQIGQEVMQILPASNEFEIDLSTLKSGIYTLGYYNKGYWKHESFVKEN
jgi:hypothetical protein